MYESLNMYEPLTQSCAPQNGMLQNGTPQNRMPQNGAPHNGTPHNGMQQNVQRLPVDAISDDALVERLYELAMHGDDASDERRQLDDAVYNRLLLAYGSEEPDLMPRMAA